MSRIDTFLGKIPGWLSSKISIFIYLFLFGYLVILALIAFLVPALRSLAPSQDAQLVLGNYTNVLSALGASIAAGSGVAIHRKMKAQHEKHEELQKTVDEIHQKIDKLAKEEKPEK